MEKQQQQLLGTFSAELLRCVLAYSDVESLFALELTCKVMHTSLGNVVEARCKAACLDKYLYPTMATYRMIAAVPYSWKLLYQRFSRLREMEWTQCKSEGTSSSLRTLKSDNQEYVADLEAQYLLRSGGHYWFSVLQTPLAEISLFSGRGQQDAELNGQLERLDALEKEKALAFLTSPSSIQVGKWEKIRADGPAPCPRRHHSMTCLPIISSSLSLLTHDNVGGAGDIYNDTVVVPMRRILFFGGQSEGIPFDAFSDLHLLLIDGRGKPASSSPKTLARWVRPQTSGLPPTRRCGHEATLLSATTLLISGGSDGTTPLPLFEIFLLHMEPDQEFGRFRWSTPIVSTPPPTGRAMHSVCRIAEDEVIIFGGRQIRQSNGLLDVHRLKLTPPGQHCDDDGVGTDYDASWCKPMVSGDPPMARRGHSTIAIGENLLLIGGQDVVSGQLHCDVQVLHIPTLRWRKPTFVSDETPCPRRGFKTQYFGTSLVVSSGFVVDPTTNKVDQQLPDSDIHVLTFL